MTTSSAKKRKEEMRQAWHSNATCIVLAQHFGLSEGALRVFWTREKAAGRLPNGPRVRDGLAPISRILEILPDELESDCIESEEDDEWIDQPVGPRHDPLLPVLRELHPGYDEAGFNTVPRAVLNAEVGRYDRTDKLSEMMRRVGGVPTPAMLRQMARAHDRAMRRAFETGKIKR
jgi:hypothetical protein